MTAFAIKLIQITLGIVLIAGLAHANDTSEVRRSLGGYPLCEASAAIVVRCPRKPEKHCLLVGDNEVKDRLFLFEIEKKDELVFLDKRREIYLGSRRSSENNDFEISDIEALVNLRSDKIAIYGSHSRNSRCEKKGKRRLFAQGKLEQTKIDKGLNAPVKSKKHKCKRLFGDDRDDLTEELCETIMRTEDRADDVEKAPGSDQKTTCSADPAFNLEGAVAVPQAGGSDRLWMGLRAPLLDGMAVMLRQIESSTAFKFDAVALVDLGGNGIRDLAYANGHVWGIAGPTSDDLTAHKLWRMDAAELKHGAAVQPFVVGALPSFSEGLAISDGNAFVLVDGSDAEPANPMVCETQSEYIVHPVKN